MADINHLGDYTVMDMLSTLESLTEWACDYTEEKPFTGVKGSFHYLMAAVNRKLGESDDTRPFSHYPYVAPVLPATPAGDWNNPARLVVATERLKRASKLVETENDRANKSVSIMLSMLSAEIRVLVELAVAGGNGVQRWTRARAWLVTNYAPTSVEWNTRLDTMQNFADDSFGAFNMFRVIDETNAIISTANPIRALTVAQKIELARKGLKNRVTKLHMSNWDWTQITIDGWDSFKSKVLAVIESDPLIEAGVRSVTKVITMKAQAAMETPSTSLIGKRDRDLSQVQCYNCGQNGHLRRHCKKKKSPTTSVSNLKPEQATQSKNRCAYCHQKGHQENRCYKKKKDTTNLAKTSSGRRTVTKVSANMVMMTKEDAAELEELRASAAGRDADN